jgi:hypothetical protein
VELDRSDALHSLDLILNVDIDKAPTDRTERFRWLLQSETTVLWMWGALLALNQQKYVTTQFVNREIKLIKGKRRVFHAHRIVEIDIGFLDHIKREYTTKRESSPKALHDVMGHFRHLHLKRDCEHQWSAQEVSGSVPRWNCTCCGGFKIRVREHKRGNEQYGVVTHEHRVRA